MNRPNSLAKAAGVAKARATTTISASFMAKVVLKGAKKGAM